jgi:uncharacterized protein YjbJ (UPF0337 family)
LARKSSIARELRKAWKKPVKIGAYRLPNLHGHSSSPFRVGHSRFFTQTSVKLKSNRRNIMESSTRDEAEGMLHQVKGKIKEIAGKASMNPDLEAEGKDEKTAGEVQKKIGQVEKVLGK